MLSIKTVEIILKVVTGVGAMVLCGIVVGTGWLMGHPDLLQKLFGPTQPFRAATYIIVAASFPLLVALFTYMRF